MLSLILRRVFYMYGIKIMFFKNRFLKRYILEHLYGYYSRPRRVGWAGGAFFIVRKDVFAGEVFFDDKLFLFNEDVDFNLEVTKKGWEVWAYNDTKIVHLWHKSCCRDPARVLLESYRSDLYYYKKHFGTGTRVIVKIILLAAILERLAILNILRIFTRKDQLIGKINAHLAAWKLVKKYK